MKRVLIIAPHFAPINAPDGHRVRMNLPYYLGNGWEAEVLCADPKHRSDWRDDSLLETLPQEIPIHRCEAIPRMWSRLLGVGTLGWRVLPFLLTAGTRILRARKFDLVYFSTTQFVCMILGPLWKKMFGLPYVIDLQDPWRNDYYQRPGSPTPPGGWKYQSAKLGARLLEPWCFRHASGFVLVSDGYKNVLEKRYPWFSAKPCSVIPFGVPLRDFQLLSSRPLREKNTETKTRICASVGALNPAFHTALDVFFKEITLSSQDHSENSLNWEYHFTGTSYQGPSDRPVFPALDAATRHGLQNSTHENSRRVAYLESLRLMKEADLLLVLGSDDLSYAPSRLHTVCAAGKPVLVVAAEGSQLAQKALEIPNVSLVQYRKKEFCETITQNFCLDQYSRQPAPLVPDKLSAAHATSQETSLFNQALSCNDFNS